MIKVKYPIIFYGLLAIEAAQPCFAQGLRIDQLGVAGTPSDSDLVAIEPGGVPPAKKMSLGALKAYVNAAAPINPNAFYVATNGSDNNRRHTRRAVRYLSQGASGDAGQRHHQDYLYPRRDVQFKFQWN